MIVKSGHIVLCVTVLTILTDRNGPYASFKNMNSRGRRHAIKGLSAHYCPKLTVRMCYVNSLSRKRVCVALQAAVETLYEMILHQKKQEYINGKSLLFIL